MSGDLFTLRMLVVSATPAIRQIWREAAGLGSVPIEFNEADPGDACPLLAKGELDILVLDTLPEAERDGAIKAARAQARAPLIALAVAAGAAGTEGATCVFARPATSREARLLVERCIRMRMPKRVLIVDDSKTMRGIVRKILSASRYALDVSEAEEGMAALKRLDGGVDLILLDYNMPGFNGLETLAEIKRVTPKVAVVMITSTEDKEVAAKAKDLGATFLKKPFYPADIDAVLDRLYELPAR
jgi:CheY-like chemotaxis protein